MMNQALALSWPRVGLRSGSRKFPVQARVVGMLLALAAVLGMLGGANPTASAAVGFDDVGVSRYGSQCADWMKVRPGPVRLKALQVGAQRLGLTLLQKDAKTWQVYSRAWSCGPNYIRGCSAGYRCKQNPAVGSKALVETSKAVSTRQIIFGSILAIGVGAALAVALPPVLAAIGAAAGVVLEAATIAVIAGCIGGAVGQGSGVFLGCPGSQVSPWT